MSGRRIGHDPVALVTTRWAGFILMTPIQSWEHHKKEKTSAVLALYDLANDLDLRRPYDPLS